MANLEFDALLAPVTDLRVSAPTALAQWAWLIPPSTPPLLLTALGDLFLTTADGAVLLLDTTNGRVDLVADSYGAWKAALASPQRVASWFLPAFVTALRAADKHLSANEVYSPIIPEVLGGKASVDNLVPTHWLAHFHVLGQVHRQVKDLPPGTPVSAIRVDPW